MVEILLALTVIAIGMTSVLGLFPVGLNASRNAIAQNCSADVADQMVTFMRVMGESSKSAYEATFETSATSLPICDDDDSGNPNNDNTDNSTLDIYTNSSGVTTINLDGGEVNIDALSLNFLDEYKRQDKTGSEHRDLSMNNSDSSSNFERVALEWAIFMPETSNLRRRIFFIVQGTNCTQNTGAHRIDYSAMALVWKEPVQIKRWNGSAWGVWPANPTDPGDPKTLPLDPTLSTSYSVSSKINIELSWPLELPYKDRKKRYYQVVINKPDS